MSVILLKKFDLLLVETEATPGTPETPTVGADAVKLRQSGSVRQNFEQVPTEEVTNTLDDALPLPGRGYVEIMTPANVKGSGTGGTEPELDALLKSCGLARTDQALVDDTAQAGGASSITLHAGASATENFYVGMPIDLNGGTGDGQKNVIVASNGTSKVATVAKPWAVVPDNTTEFVIPVNDIYRLASTSLSAITAWLYQRNKTAAADAVRAGRFTGGRGNAAFRLPTGGLFTVDFTHRGQFVAAPDDVAAPSAPNYDPTEPVVFKGADVCHFGGVAANFRELSFDLSNRVIQDDDPSAAQGYDIADIVGRSISGRLNPSKALIATRDPFADFLASTGRILAIRWGSAAGNRIAITMAPVRVGVPEDEVSDEFYKHGIPFRSNELHICFF